MAMDMNRVPHFQGTIGKFNSGHIGLGIILDYDTDFFSSMMQLLANDLHILTLRMSVMSRKYP